MNEEFIYYLWTYKLLINNLITTQGETISIISTGIRNTDSGPDFFNALIDIGKTRWAGNVEMHVNSSDWFKHNHNDTREYDNIILHVVFNDDRPIYRRSGERIPTLEINNKFDGSLLLSYEILLKSNNSIACANQIHEIKQLDKLLWLDGLMAERLEKKSFEITTLIDKTKGDLLQVYYQKLSRAMGYTANSDSMEYLASITPLKLLLKHKNSILQIEALLYGQAGFFENSYVDLYPNQLSKEYAFLKTKYKLTNMDNSLWRFMRMRPVSFPTIRISQLANIIYNTSGLLSFILEMDNINNVVSILSSSASSYWDNHFRFDAFAPGVQKKLGKSTINVILINTIIPFIFVYGKSKRNAELHEKALNWMAKIPSESNKITREFISMGITPENAMHSQALLQLKSNYCLKKSCLRCKFGHILLNRQIIADN
ncbi:MAG: DUF2851 family protein [Bacteroidetes bacterium]|nr:DUF2851 family protein [Bacteroidota bacterium]